jgi:hypothetical protein
VAREQITLRGSTPHGPYREWWDNGTLALEGTLASGAPVGEFQAWDPSGRLLGTSRIVSGTGTLTRWFPSGIVQSHAIYTDGYLHTVIVNHGDGSARFVGQFSPRWPGSSARGRFVEWYPDGTVRVEGSYTGPDRPWVRYDPDGIPHPIALDRDRAELNYPAPIPEWRAWVFGVRLHHPPLRWEAVR